MQTGHCPGLEALLETVLVESITKYRLDHCPGPDALLDSAIRQGRHSHMIRDFIGPLHLVPVAPDRIIGLSPIAIEMSSVSDCGQ